MKELKWINPSFENYEFNWGEAYSYGKVCLKKYKENVISYRITEESCFILLKGVRKYFGYRFSPDLKRVRRVKKIKLFIKNKGIIVDEKEYSLFKRVMILEALKNENN
jgi:hypothetical protein